MSSPRRIRPNGEANKLQAEDSPAHAWYRFVLSFPPHLVRDYLDRFGVSPGQTVLDPFCGTGTVLIEARKRGIHSIGIEANPMAHFATATKLDWSPDPDLLLEHAAAIAVEVRRTLRVQGIDEYSFSPPRPCIGELYTLPPESTKLLLSNSISPLPLHKVLTLRDAIYSAEGGRYIAHELLALSAALVTDISNLHFGPEVGVGPAKLDAPVVDLWIRNVKTIAADLRRLQTFPAASAEAILADSRNTSDLVSPSTVDAVITSPPYPNEKDYTRTTRLESVVLGFFSEVADLRTLKRRLVRSNTRGVYRGDDDDEWASQFPEIHAIANAIEARRIELGKTSGFERLYPRVTKLYFGGMARHLAGLRLSLKPGAHLAYVVGDQASYLRVLIRTGTILANIAESLGYEVIDIDLFRTRLATATRTQLREEVLVLRWPGFSADARS